MKAKYAVYTCVLLLFGLAVVPRASAQIDQFQYFGSEISMDYLDNITIGAATSSLNAQALSFRFTALEIGSIQSVAGYLITNPDAGDPPKPPCEYACGTGGTLVVQLMEDDGTPSHHPKDPTQTAPLGTASLANAAGANVFYSFEFSPAIPVTANTIYHLVWTNPTGSGTSGNGSGGSGNFVSVETLYTTNAQPTPAISTDQLSALELPTGSGVTWASGWIELSPDVHNGASYMPIVNFVYSTPSGATQGLGYIQVGSATNVGGSDAIREVMTMPSNNVTVSGVNVRFALSTGTGELHAHLEDGSGNTIDDCYIASSSFGSGSNYASCNFTSSHTLLANQTYHIDFEADSGTVYQALPMENGEKANPPGYGAGAVFPYGHAEYETSGTWIVLDPTGMCSAGCWDWQFYFNVT
jgi:hypothetical protein